MARECSNTRPASDAGALTPDSPLWAWATEAISQRAGDMLAHLEGVRDGSDIEAVHDMRVASRRLVAAMKVFALAFPGPEFAALLSEARRVTRRLGAVRDLDVLLDHFGRAEERAAGPEATGLAYVRVVLRREWERARRPMLAALATLEKRDLPGRLQRFLRDEADAYRVGLLPAPEWRPAAVSPTQPFRAVAPPILEERLAELLAYEPHVEHPEHAAELHEMRIKAKWLRYTMELFAPAYADGLKKQLAAVKKLQELLGDLHDSDVRLWLLDDMLGAPLRAAGLEALGLLNPDPVKEGLRALRERELGERQACYIAFRREWRRLARADFPAACLARIRRADG